MYSINLVNLTVLCGKRFGHPAWDVLLFAPSAWLLVFTPKMALRTGLARLDHSRVARDTALLSLVGGLCVVICYMTFEQVSAACQMGLGAMQWSEKAMRNTYIRAKPLEQTGQIYGFDFVSM